MGTIGKMVAAQEATLKASTLAEAEAIKQRLQAEEQEVADVFFTQEATIADLQEMLRTQDQQATYISPPQPVPARPNYILYALIGVVLLFMFGKVKL